MNHSKGVSVGSSRDQVREAKQAHGHGIDLSVTRAICLILLENTATASTNERSSQQTISNRHISSIDHPSSSSDWSVPPTIELSPTSITSSSSSPDLSQNLPFNDDASVEVDAHPHLKHSLSLSCPILPSFTMCGSQTNALTPQSSTHLSNPVPSMIAKARASPIHSSALQRMSKRHFGQSNGGVNHSHDTINKSKTKLRKCQQANQVIIEHLLKDMIE